MRKLFMALALLLALPVCAAAQNTVVDSLTIASGATTSDTLSFVTMAPFAMSGPMTVSIIVQATLNGSSDSVAVQVRPHAAGDFEALHSNNVAMKVGSNSAHTIFPFGFLELRVVADTAQAAERKIYIRVR